MIAELIVKNVFKKFMPEVVQEMKLKGANFANVNLLNQEVLFYEKNTGKLVYKGITENFENIATGVKNEKIGGLIDAQTVEDLLTSFYIDIEETETIVKLKSKLLGNITMKFKNKFLNKDANS